MARNAEVGTLAVAARLAGIALLGFLAALALGSCGGDGEAIGTGSVTRSLPAASAPVRTEVSETVTRTETVTSTETAPAATETVTHTETAPAATETVTVTQTAPAVTLTATVATETVPVATSAAAPLTVTVSTTVTTGMSPAAAAAAGAAAAKDEDGLTSTEWGWVAFAVLAAAILLGGIVWWLRTRSRAKKRADEVPPAPNLPT